MKRMKNILLFGVIVHSFIDGAVLWFVWNNFPYQLPHANYMSCVGFIYVTFGCIRSLLGYNNQESELIFEQMKKEAIEYEQKNKEK